MKDQLKAFIKKDFSNPENNDSLKNFVEKKRLMNFNRFFSNYKVFTITYAVIAFVFIAVIMAVMNSLQGLKINLLTGEFSNENPSIFVTIREFWGMIVVLLILAVILYVRFAYGVRVSFGNLNVGQKGTASFTTREEIEEQYIKVPEKDEKFKGIGGIPIARDGESIYIDDTTVNNLVIGTTRSGKGQTTVEPMIDIYSRAEMQASMVVTDPKLELSSKMIPELTRRGYECYVLNLINPEYSMGYNPLKLIIDEYKSGDIDSAQQLCASLGHAIIPTNEGDKDPYWPDQARNTFVAAMWAEIEDNIQKDILDNKRYLREHQEKEAAREKEYYKKLYGEEYEIFILKREIDKILKNEPEITDKAVQIELLHRIRAEIITNLTKEEVILANIRKALDFSYKESNFKKRPFYPSTENEDRITIYSIIKFCNALSEHRTGENRTALDDYFSKRDEDNFAKITYGAIISASEQTKGTIMSTFRSKVAIFGQSSIAKMTAESSVNFTAIGFGKKPIAIFIGLPDYDKSNWFISTVFINQMYFILAKLATAMPGGKLNRRVAFILDEFGNIPKIENMSNILTVCLGRNMVFTLVVQALSQLEKYEEEARTIKGNCGNIIYILSGDEDTAEEISNRLGKETITNTNRTGKKLSINKEFTEMMEEKPLMTPDEVMKLKMGETIVFRTMFRETRTGERKSIQAKPIANIGEHRMKYAYEFFPEYFPPGQMLYESPELRKIFEENENLKNIKLTIANVRLETTKHIVLKERSRSASEYLEEIRWVNQPFLENDFSMSKIGEIFTLMNLSDEQKQLYLIAGTKDEEGQVIMPEYTLYNYQIIDYANKLINYHSREIIEKGFALMQLMKPLYLRDKKKTKEEYLAAEAREQEMLNAINMKGTEE